MSDLDDALNTSAPAILPPYLTALWKEVPSNIVSSGNPDSVVYLDEQMRGAYEVTHSLDDGFPDAVTMTTSNDAGGKMVVPLIGKQGTTAVDIGWRGTRTQNGTISVPGTFTQVPVPTSGVFWGDYLIACVSVNSQSAVITPEVTDPTSPFYWTPLGNVTDGSTQKLYIYGIRCYAGITGFRFTSSIGISWGGVMVGAYARTANPSIWVDFKPARLILGNQAAGSGVTTHTIPQPVQLKKRGFVLGVWAEQGTTGGVMTPQAPQTQLVQNTATAGILVSSSPLIEANLPAYFQTTATTTAATNIIMMAAIALEIQDRPFMDARQYFSPFNTESPVYGFDRDTASVYLTNNFLGPNGPAGTTIFSGQMVDIPFTGREAELGASSATRLMLDKSLTLPVISDRENCTVDWLATWAMARGGQYAGPAPTVYTRFWAPMYGSTHAHFASDYAYGGSLFYDLNVTPTGPFGLRPPQPVTGPFVTGMYAQQTSDRIEEVFLSGKRLDLVRDQGLPLPYQPDAQWQFNDQFSQASSSGRMVMWIRNDYVFPAPTYVDASNDFMFRYTLYCISPAGVYLGYVIIEARTADRRVYVRMGADHTGSTTIVFNSSPGLTIPQNSNWSFIGVKWNFALGSVEVNVNGTTGVSSAYATNGDNDITVLPATESAGVAQGIELVNYIRSHVPISDFLIESGPGSWTRDWTDHYPSPVGSNAVMRPTNQTIKAVTESSPIQGWDLLSQLAQASLCAYRTNEDDNLEFLPLSYFGETAQITPVAVADTEVNAGELNVVVDPSKMRNVVTLNYPETRVDTNISPVMAISSSIELKIGVTDITFPLDRPAAEIHGQSNPFDPIWTLTNLTGPQISNPSTIPAATHYITANDRADGTGTPLGQPAVIAQIISATASTITIRFTNNRVKSAYLANNGDQVPFVMILGYAVNAVEAYTTQRDSGSIGKRRERSLTADLGWIQDRATAVTVAQRMVMNLARPRPQVQVEVMADPRRVPGDMVMLADSQGTKAEGTWRVMKVSHNADGPKYTQVMDLVRVEPMTVWDDYPGWDNSTWAP